MKKLSKTRLLSLLGGALAATQGLAGTYNNDFSNPAAPGLSLVGGVRANGADYPKIENGYLALTYAENSLQGSAWVTDLDPGVAVGGFTANFDVRVGGGTSTPADGWAFVYATNGDPFSTFGEEGPLDPAGLTVSFDNYDNGGGEAPAIDVKWNGAVIARRSMSVFDMLSDNFVPVRIQLNNNGTLNVAYRGNIVFTNLFIEGFAPMTGGIFGFGARTGGLNANHWIDNLSITTTPAGAATAPTVATAPASQTVAEHASVTFSVIPQGTPPFTFQWLSNNVAIAGATSPSFTITNAPFSANQASYSVRVSNAQGNVVSSPAVLTVQQDVAAPTIASVQSDAGFNRVVVTFSEAVSASAGNAANYSLSGGLSISGVTVLSPTQVALSTSLQTPGTSYTLTVNNVSDRATIPNTIAANTAREFSAFVESKGFLKFEFWTGIGGTAVDELVNNDRYIAGTPDLSGYVSSFNSRNIFADDSRENYGARMSGFITPAVSGDYRFFVSSDDASRLFLSPDSNPANLAQIAEETGCCNGFTEPDSPRTSEPISLVAGQKYAVMYLYKEGGGGDYGMVAWRREGDTTSAGALQPISGRHLSAFADPGIATINFTTQPTSRTAAENATTTFTVAATGSPSPMFVQWQRAAPNSSTFVDIPGANGLSYTTPVLKQTADNGAKYRAVISVPGRTANSSEAALTVEIDRILPRLLSATPGINLKNVTLQFSEEVQAAAAGTASNYTIPGLAVTAATVSSNIVRLITAPQAPGTDYTVTVSANVKDSAGNAMDSSASSASFQSLVQVPGAVREDFYTGIGTTSVGALLSSPKYPGSPDETRLLGGFDAVNGYGENYGAALSGFVTPTVTGDYRFFIASDDASQLFISTSDDPANLGSTPIAREDACCGGFMEPGEPETSEPIRLEAGKSYYLLFLFKEGGGGDWGRVAWRNETDPTPASELAPLAGPVVSTAVPRSMVQGITLSTDVRSALGSGQTPGFKARIHQANQEGSTGLQNTISRAEQQLAGIIATNVADLQGAVNGIFPISGVINWSGDPSEAGNFQSTSDPSRPDSPIPGIPGLGANPNTTTDNIAGEIITYVEFPTPGFYFLGVNSDDGFNVTATDAPPQQTGALVINNGAAAGSYYAISAGRGENGGVFRPITAPITGKLVLAQPIDACSALTNPDQIRGNIAVIDRGVCAFSIKVQMAKDAGAIAVIMVNSRDPGAAEGIWPITMTGAEVDLPAVMITKPDGAIIKSAMASGQINATLTADQTPSLGKFNGGRGASDTIFPVYVPEAGVYPLRTVWFEGGGGANLELFSLVNGRKVLINDPEVAGSLKAFQTRQGFVPRPQLSIQRLADGQIRISWTNQGTLESSDRLDGTYSPVNGASSPFTTAPTDSKRFFRVRR